MFRPCWRRERRVYDNAACDATLGAWLVPEPVPWDGLPKDALFEGLYPSETSPAPDMVANFYT
jgi:hypothetical protein